MRISSRRAIREFPASAGRAPAGWRWAAWADRLAGRYAAGLGSWDALAAVLRRAEGGEAADERTVRETPQFFSRPVLLNLHLTIPAVQVAVQRPSPGQSLAPGAPASAVAAPPAAVLAQEVVNRLVARERVTSWRETQIVTRMLSHLTARADSPASEAWTAVPPVPQVVNRPPAAAEAEKQTKREETASPAPGLRYWEESRGLAAAPVDVEGLTDQVIRSIDQRVVAARERLGKGVI